MKDIDFLLCQNLIIKEADTGIAAIKRWAKEKILTSGKIQLQILDLSQEISVKNEYESLLAGYANTVFFCHDDYSHLLSKAIANAKGKYVNFCNASSELSLNAYSALIKTLDKESEMLLLKSKFFFKKRRNDIQPYAYNGKQSVDLNQDYRRLLLVLDPYLIPFSLLQDIELRENIYDSSEMELLIKVLANHPQYKIIDDILMTIHELQPNFDCEYRNIYFKWWYHDDLNHFIIPLINELKTSSLYTEAMQYAIYFLIACKYFQISQEKNLETIRGKEITEFHKLCRKALLQINDNVILDINKYHVVPTYFVLQLLKIRNEGKVETKYETIEDNLRVVYNGQPFTAIKDCHLGIQNVNMTGNTLQVSGVLHGEFMLENAEFSIYAQINDQRFVVRETEMFNPVECFGMTLSNGYPFQCSINLENFSLPFEINWFLEISEQRYSLRWQTIENYQTRLNTKRKKSYWTKKPYVFQYKNEKVVVKKYHGFLQTMGNEVAALIELSCSRPRKDNIINALFRLMYWMAKVIWRNKNIYMLMDKLYYGGDNGQYLFEYYMAHPELKVDAHYIINRKSRDYPALKEKYKSNIVEFNSLRNKLLALNAKVIVATSKSGYGYCSIETRLSTTCSELCNAEVISVFHGVMIWNLEKQLTRTYSNLKRVMLTSKYEKENLLQPKYDYDETMLRLTGFPRYDGLISKRKKQILLAFTWRQYVTMKNFSRGSARRYNTEFKSTDYYKIYSRLIEDKQLLNVAKKLGYKICFLLHPTLTSQRKDFKASDIVEILEPTLTGKYETLLTESDMMVTDYTGVQHDFAYMKKPVLYYHNEKLPPQFKEAEISIRNAHALYGEVCTTHESIVNLMCQYMENDCQMKPFYIERVNDFFKYTDRDNCRRVTEEIESYMSLIEKT